MSVAETGTHRSIKKQLKIIIINNDFIIIKIMKQVAVPMEPSLGSRASVSRPYELI